MRVLYCHPVEGRGDRKAVAFLDVELTPDVRLYGLRLVRQPDGRHMVYAPQAGQRRVATFSKPLAQSITDAAVAALEAAR
ncbi:hypothetical protein [Hoeflea alexandrii]|uniref:hypothetical protein n=1 Tax=Hoeflea alexandrii TaxID=288436 RepID=UPI0022AF942C|nr:hypothetical protein [Hoeflea alexandrii]MCZ4287864.1 hypothetical protein [Hoeflea alexandrii]